ncbi:MAG: TM2 domain-containing protein [Cryobacterium sp.]|nr:TM2 domain-containing protein [Cryobacterium sp.]
MSIPASGSSAAGESAPVDPSLKLFLATWILSLFFGFFGADRFYLGKTGTAVLKLLTFGGAGIWWLIDLVLVLIGAQRDRFGRELTGHERFKVVAWIISATVVIICFLVAPYFYGRTSSSGELPGSSPTTSHAVAGEAQSAV